MYCTMNKPEYFETTLAYGNNTLYYEHNLYRQTSNCSDSEESGEEESADQSPSAVGVAESDTSTDRITTLPEEMIAYELVESLSAKKKKSLEGKKISLQETTKRIRMTPAAKRREDMADKMLALYEKEQSRSQEEVEDEYVMSFLSMAKRVNTLLNKHQKERVLQEVEEVVRRKINKALDAEEVCSAATTGPPRNHPSSTTCYTNASTLYFYFRYAKFPWTTSSSSPSSAMHGPVLQSRPNDL